MSHKSSTLTNTNAHFEPQHWINPHQGPKLINLSVFLCRLEVLTIGALMPPGEQPPVRLTRRELLTDPVERIVMGVDPRVYRSVAPPLPLFPMAKYSYQTCTGSQRHKQLAQDANIKCNTSTTKDSYISQSRRSFGLRKLARIVECVHAHCQDKL